MQRVLMLALTMMMCAWAASPAQAQLVKIDHVHTCDETVPTAVDLPSGDPIEFHVHVVLDGVTLEEGRAAMAQAQRAYEPLGLRLVTSFTTARTSSGDARGLMSELKTMFGGVRPPWAHVVYLMVRRDFTDGATDVAGIADCIGGVAFPYSAFAIGEFDRTPIQLGPAVSWGGGLPAKSAAHEIGHLFGAQHQYAACQPDAVADDLGDLSPCTLMFPEASLISLVFSPLNAAVVRGHALAFLEPLTASPPPDGSPTPTTPMPACELRVYNDPPGDHARFFVNQPDDADLLAGTFHTQRAGEGEVVRFTWKLASVDGQFTPGASVVKYELIIERPRPLTVRVTWDGTGDPVGEVLQDGVRVASAPATITRGAGGTITAELPLRVLGLEGKALHLGYLRAMKDLDDQVSFDTSSPAPAVITPGVCA